MPFGFQFELLKMLTVLPGIICNQLSLRLVHMLNYILSAFFMLVIHRCVRCEQTFINVSKSCDCSSPNVLVSRRVCTEAQKKKLCGQVYKFSFFFFSRLGDCVSVQVKAYPQRELQLFVLDS